MTHCKSGHDLTPETSYVTKAGQTRCKTCRNIYQRSLRLSKKEPIADWEPKDASTTPIYFPNIIFKHAKNTSWYERSRAQVKLLSSHRYAVRGPSART